MSAGTTAMASDAEDIRDIRGPKSNPEGWALAVGIAAALLLTAIAYAVWRRRRPHPAPLTAAAAALRRLDAIRPLLMPATAREFCSAASDIVRSYIEQRFSILASRRTTEEFLQELLRSPATPLAGHRALLTEFLENCDIVKFAGLSTAEESLETLDRTARRFIDATAAAEAA